MRRVVFILPGWIAGAEDESVLRQNLPALTQLAEQSTLFKLAALPSEGLVEAAYLGLDPRKVQMAQGPLTVAALGADPPDRSVHFHLSLMSFDGSTASSIEHSIPDEQARTVTEAARRLNTNKLTIVPGAGDDHGLVWEDGSQDLNTQPPTAIQGQPLRPHLPEGDGEPLLRRLIDDSINLLTDLPLNQERIDQELPPLSLLWPWGHGFRQPVPNLMLRRGEQARVESPSLRLQGLTRLANYVHGNRFSLGEGTNLKLERLRSLAETESPLIVVIDAFASMRRQQQTDEAAWLTHEIDRRLIQPLLESRSADPASETRLALLAPSPHGGLGLTWSSRAPVENYFPFDERTLDERLVPSKDLWTAVDEAVRLASTPTG